MKSRLVCFSAYSANLRATAFSRFLREAGYEIIQPRPHGPPGSIGELALTLLPNCWLALTVRADLAAGFKPHPNVTLPLLICKWRGIPTWIDVDDLDHAYRQGWMSKLVEWLQRPFPRQFRVISYHNPRLREYLIHQMGCAPERLLRIPQGVNARQFAALPAAVALPQLAGKRVAIYAAHLNVASDLEPVLHAWQQVTREIPQAALLVIGGGPMLADFRALAGRLGLEGRVYFTGEVPHTEVPAYFARGELAVLYMTDRLVNAYRCSLKLREYFAAGLKVVCNNYGELAEYADQTYQTGPDLAEFAAMIVRVLHGHDDGRQLRARARAQAELDWPRIVQAAATELARRVKLAPPMQIR